MEVNTNAIPRTLSNYEVHGLLKTYSAEMKTGKHKTGQHDQNLSTVAYEVLKYLENTPCVNQNAECISSVCAGLVKYKLTKSEMLQIVNLRPTTPVEVSLIVEESEERLTEAQIDEIINLIKDTIPPGPGSEDKEEEDEEMEEEEEEEG